MFGYKSNDSERREQMRKSQAKGNVADDFDQAPSINGAGDEDTESSSEGASLPFLR